MINQYDFTYSAGGNVTQEINSGGDINIAATDADMTYGSDNRLATFNGKPVSYDADGNMTTGPVLGTMQALTYDSRNRLLSAGGVTYTYDSTNNRIASATIDQTAKFVVNPVAPLSQILMEKNGAGTITAYYVYGLGLIGRQDAADNSYRIYHYDRRGSTVALTDTVGTITDTYNYAAYGERFSHATGAINQPFLYNGRDGVVTDASGLYNMRARYYNPQVKRFVNMDTLLGGIDDGQSLNLYAFIKGNPASFIDPLGNMAVFDRDSSLGDCISSIGSCAFETAINGKEDNFIDFGQLVSSVVLPYGQHASDKLVYGALNWTFNKNIQPSSLQQKFEDVESVNKAIDAAQSVKNTYDALKFTKNIVKGVAYKVSVKEVVNIDDMEKDYYLMQTIKDSFRQNGPLDPFRQMYNTYTKAFNGEVFEDIIEVFK